MASLVRCHKCKKMVNVKNTALCSACNNRYELNCDGYPEATYKLKDAEGKKKWRCTACVRQKKYSNAEVSASSVTLRKKPTLKIKSPIEHNTKLQPPRAPQNTSLPDSHDVLTDCEISDESYNNSSFCQQTQMQEVYPACRLLTVRKFHIYKLLSMILKEN